LTIVFIINNNIISIIKLIEMLKVSVKASGTWILYFSFMQKWLFILVMLKEENLYRKGVVKHWWVKRMVEKLLCCIGCLGKVYGVEWWWGGSKRTLLL